jgi:hypothetical protein
MIESFINQLRYDIARHCFRTVTRECNAFGYGMCARVVNAFGRAVYPYHASANTIDKW